MLMIIIVHADTALVIIVFAMFVTYLVCLLLCYAACTCLMQLLYIQWYTKGDQFWMQLSASPTQTRYIG